MPNGMIKPGAFARVYRVSRTCIKCAIKNFAFCLVSRVGESVMPHSPGPRGKTQRTNRYSHHRRLSPLSACD